MEIGPVSGNWPAYDSRVRKKCGVSRAVLMDGWSKADPSIRVNEDVLRN